MTENDVDDERDAHDAEQPTAPPGNWKAKKMLRFRVIPPEEGQTLRALLFRRLPGINKEDVSALIRDGGVYINRLRVRLTTVRVAAGERVTVYPIASDTAPVTKDDIEIVHQDETFVIVDKHPGMPVSAVKESARGTVSEGLMDLLRSQGVVRPYVGVVHRLDRGASGLVLLTIRGVANASVHRQFVEHGIRRVYRLRCHGDVPSSVRCDLPLRKLSTGGVKVAEPGERGAQTAITHFRKIISVPGKDHPEHLVEAILETGRTHQIRAHAAHLGFPLRGDRRYGETSLEANGPEHERLCLHAWTLEFEHPTTGELLRFESALPSWAQEGQRAPYR